MNQTRFLELLRKEKALNVENRSLYEKDLLNLSIFFELK